MAFHDVELPQGVQYTSTAGAGFATIVQETASGHEFRITRQAQGRHRFRLIKSLQTTAEAQALKAFALGRRGSLHAFKLQDFSDNTSRSDGIDTPTATDQLLGVGDATETVFQLTKLYDATGPAPYNRIIRLPVAGSVVVALAGTPTGAFTVNGDGAVVMTSAPGNGVLVTAGFRYLVPVRFERTFDQWAQLRADAFGVWALPDMDCVEVLNEVEQPERFYPGGARVWGNVTQNLRLSFNDGSLHTMTALAAISLFLPVPYRHPGGDHIFSIYCHPSSSNNVQVRDDAGISVGSAFGSGGGFRQVGLARDLSGNITWVLY